MYVNPSTEVQVQLAVAVIRRLDSPTVRWCEKVRWSGSTLVKKYVSPIFQRFVDPTIR
jgi:hypothetical protein